MTITPGDPVVHVAAHLARICPDDVFDLVLEEARRRQEFMRQLKDAGYHGTQDMAPGVLAGESIVDDLARLGVRKR